MADHSETLARLTADYREAAKRLSDARTELIKGLRAASTAGMRQADIVRAIDHEWTREYVRKVLAAPAEGDQGEPGGSG